MGSLQSVADRKDVVVVCRKPFSAYAGLDVLLARIHGDGRFEVLSAAWEGILGFRCDELNGSSLFALLPFDEATARALLRRITDPAEPEPMVFEVRCKGSAPIRLRWHRRFDPYADAMFIAGQREEPGAQSPDRKRDSASDSAFNAA
jgi:PAS domain-containing protein